MSDLTPANPLLKHDPKSLRLYLTVLTTWLIWSLTGSPWAYAETPTTPTSQAPTLRVGSVPERTLFQDQNGIYSGFYVDLWDAIATDLNIKYEWVVSDTLANLRKSIQQGQVDVGASHLSITAEHERLMDFTHPVFNDGYQLYVPATGSGGKFSLFSLLYSTRFLTIVGQALLVLIVLAHVVWLAEKNKLNSHFRPGYLHGLGDALWWSIVTVTTVGYGDKIPKSRLGRIIGLGWMIASLFVVSLLAGHIATMVTLAHLEGSIKTIGDLPGKAVGVVGQTVFDDFVVNLDIEPIRYNHSTDLFQDLAVGKLDVVVSDIISSLALPRQLAAKIKKAGSTFKRDNIAFGLPQGSPHQENINRALMAINDDGRYDNIYARWFRESN